MKERGKEANCNCPKTEGRGVEEEEGRKQQSSCKCKEWGIEPLPLKFDRKSEILKIAYNLNQRKKPSKL